MKDMIEFFINGMITNIEAETEYKKIKSASAKSNYVKNRLTSIGKQLVEISYNDQLTMLRNHKHLVYDWCWTDSDETYQNSGITDNPSENPQRDY